MTKNTAFFVLFAVFLCFIGCSFILDFSIGKDIGNNFFLFSKSMMMVLPVIFILIGLFDVWVPREIIEAHMGADSGLKGYFWSIVLAGLTVGGLFVAFPIAHAIYKKGAKLSVIFFYVGAASVCRLPMSLYEASFLGVKFTMVRLLVTFPLIFVSALIFSSILKKRNFKIGHD